MRPISGTDTLSKIPFCSSKPGHEKTCLMSYANNKGVDQPARISVLSVTKISSLMLASVDE